MSNSKLFFGVLLIIFTYYITYAIFLGIKSPIPIPGDSWDYHIPISNTIINGQLLHPENFKLPQWYYPGSAEIFIALYSILKIPLTLSNILATIILVISLFKLGIIYKLEKYHSLIFALTFCTTIAVTRWLNAISIDIWISIFFIWTLIYFQKLKNDIDFLWLGFFSGMMIGSKYTGILFLIVLLIFYFNNFKENLNFKRLIIFLVPFSFFGIFWYARNFYTMSNPFYPIKILNLPGQNLFSNYVWNISFHYPTDMFNAFFSEYKLLFFLPLLAIVLLIINFKKMILTNDQKKILSIGIILFVFYFINPTSNELSIMISSLRYSYISFIFLLLGIFLVIQKYKKENYLYLVIIACSINSLSMLFYPKLIFIYLPASLLIFYLVEKLDKN